MGGSGGQALCVIWKEEGEKGGSQEVKGKWMGQGEFSRGQGGHRLGRGTNNLTQFCTQGPVGQRPHSHPDTDGHLCSKKF